MAAAAGGHGVRKVSDATGSRVREALERDGYEFRDLQYARWSASGPGITVTLYDNGKLLWQGKHADDFAITYLDEVDDVFAQKDAAAEDRVTEPIIGTDESGKGDYFGPLVVAAMLVRPEDVPVLATLGVRDSKTVADRDAIEMARTLLDAYPKRIGVVSIGPARYNEMHREFGGNLNRLLAWAHAKAVAEVIAKEPCGRVLSDKFGNERLIADALRKQKIEVRLEQRVRAESHPAVAAASVLARARFLVELRRLGDGIGEKLHKGAGTPVDVIARSLWKKGGLPLLGQVAKLHFKTTEKSRP
jgi:ribonuclease HIII